MQPDRIRTPKRENGVIGRREGRRLSLGFLDILIHPSPLSLFSDRLSPGLSTLLPLSESYDAKMEGRGNLFCFPLSSCLSPCTQKVFALS